MPTLVLDKPRLVPDGPRLVPDKPGAGEQQIGAYEPGWWESIKGRVLFPQEAGYGGRWTKPSREEKLWRALDIAPRTGLTAIGGALDRAKRMIGGVTEPGMAAISEQLGPRGKRPEGALPFIPSAVRGLKAAIRKPGAPTEAPTYGEALERSWFEPLTGEEAPPWYAPSQDISLDILMLLGPKAFRQFTAARAAKPAAGGRLEPAKFKETWQELGGTVHRAGTTIKEVSPTTPIAEKPIEKLTRLIGTAERIEKGQRKLRHVEMQKRVARYAGTLGKGKGKEAFYAARGRLKGPMPTAQFSPPELEMSPAEMNALVEQVRTTGKLLPLQKGNAFDALQQLFQGKLPQRNQLILLEREFGSELIKAVLGKRAPSAKAVESILDAANLPRTFLTSYDISASLRQTYISATRHPVLWSKAFKAQLKALASEKNALVIQEGIRHSKHYESAVRYKLYLPDIRSAAAPLSARPEEYMSRFASHIPGIKASERAFVTMGNKVRFELWSKYNALWDGAGRTEADYAALAKYLNAVTGRGTLAGFEEIGPALNAILFSPRYLTSRIQTVGALAGRSNAVRKIAAGDLTAFIGVTSATLAAAKFFWGDKVDVELDPRSSDFGKMKIGNTRIDPWAGFQPLVRYATQAWTGERKTATGKIQPERRIITGGRFLRSKLSPLSSFIVDLHTGTTFVGEEVKAANWPEELQRRFVPLAIQDIIEAGAHQGLGAGLITLPAATLGIGAITWEPSAFQQSALFKDELSRKYFGKEWDKLGVLAQQAIRRQYPQIEQWERKGKAEQKQFGFIKKVLREQAQAGQNVQKDLFPAASRELKRLYIPISLNRNVSKDWHLNDDRYEQYQKLTGRYLNIVMSRLLKSEGWGKRGDENKRQIIEQAINESKQAARNQIIKQGALQDLWQMRKAR